MGGYMGVGLASHAWGPKPCHGVILLEILLEHTAWEDLCQYFCPEGVGPVNRLGMSTINVKMCARVSLKLKGFAWWLSFDMALVLTV
jgi:hypothetical protein